jgi:hypothetical protein
MPEGLRNAGPTFNRMVKIVLGPHFKRNVSSYIDDVVIHNKRKEQHIEDLRETLANLRKYDLMLNPEKCIFGVSRENYWAAWCQIRHSSKPREDRGNKKHENTTNKKRYPEAHQKNSNIGTLHNVIGRTKLTILQAVVCEGQDQLGSPRAGGIRIVQILPGKFGSANKSSRQSKAIVVHCSFRQCIKRNSSGREK